MNPYNVISLDGGGVRGVITAVFLDEIERRCPGYSKRVHLFAGSSIGAANAVGLAAHGGAGNPMVCFYREHGRQLFSRPFPVGCGLGPVVEGLESIPGLGGYVSQLRELFLPKWSPKGLEDALALYFEEGQTLGDLRPAHVLVTAMSLSRRFGDADLVAPVCITNYEEEFLDLQLPTALLRSMSAPTYFPSTADGYVDGGVFAANPSIAAIGVAIEQAGRDLSDVRMLSIGTGIASDGIQTRGRALDWGQLRWAKAFPGASSMAEIEFDHWHCERLLGDRYCRLNMPLPVPVPMDDYRSIRALEDEARRQLDGPHFQKALDFVQTYFA